MTDDDKPASFAWYAARRFWLWGEVVNAQTEDLERLLDGAIATMPAFAVVYALKRALARPELKEAVADYERPTPPVDVPF